MSLAVFDQLRQRLARLPRVGAVVAKRGAAAFSARAAAAFAARESVYGAPFGTGKDGPIDLEESGALKGKALAYSAHGTTIKASVGAVRYARYQLKHGILPLRGKLPADWRAELEAIADEELTKAAEGRG